MKQEILKDYFGHNSFRPLQEEGIDAILSGRDLVMILPTGGGKSLVFQLPTLMKDGLSVVISPLIALMQDQVASLLAQNMSAAMLSSAQTKEQSDEVISQLHQGKLKFLYLSPERLNTGFILSLLRSLDINFFVIDEAHCISQWGHEFRDDYRALGRLRANFPHTPICAFTATSTSHVTEDILRELQLNNPLLLKGKIYRENLFINIQRRISNGYDQLKRFLVSHKNKSGIIYVSSRKKTEELSNFLNINGYKSLPYHAGLPQHTREQNFKIFVNDKVDIMVATIAFGMGIDKSDIRFVVHMSLPKSIENYYQEIGRAGRDGEKSGVLLLFNASDIAQHKRFLEELPPSEYKEHIEEKIEQIYRYATSEECLHQQLAEYFEDTLEPCVIACANCTQSDAKRKDITRESQMLLSAIYKSNQAFGKNYIIDILRGSKDQKLLQNGADKLSTYAIGKHFSKKEWFVVLERLLELKIILIGEFMTLKLSQNAVDVLKGKIEVTIKSSRLEIEKKAESFTEEDTNYDKELFEALRKKRTELAQELGVPAYLVFSDKTLKQLASARPMDKLGMLEINGIGMKKYEQFGEEFLGVLEGF